MEKVTLALRRAYLQSNFLIVSGNIEFGTLGKGFILSSDYGSFVVKSIQYRGEKVDFAYVGQSIALQLEGKVSKNLPSNLEKQPQLFLEGELSSSSLNSQKSSSLKRKSFLQRFFGN